MFYAEDFRRTAREALRDNWGLAIGTGFIAGLLGGGASLNFGSSSNIKLEDLQQFAYSNFGWYLKTVISTIAMLIVFWVIISLLLGGAIKLGYCRFNMNLIDNNNPQFNDLFSRFDIFWKAFAMQLLIGLYIFLWSLLFIIPGIIASIRYAMTPYILEENPSMDINEAIEYSKEMMDGNKWRYFCLGLSFIGWEILCIFTLGIGFLWLKPYINAANAVFYKEVSGKNNF